MKPILPKPVVGAVALIIGCLLLGTAIMILLAMFAWSVRMFLSVFL